MFDSSPALESRDLIWVQGRQLKIMKKKIRKVKTPKELCFNRCKKLWNDIIYLRAGNKSEISGQEARNAHHVKGKSNYMLRFDTRNGINLTSYEHILGIHSNDPDKVVKHHELINNALKRREGDNILDILEMEKNNNSKPDIFMIELKLKQELKEYQGRLEK